MVDISRVRPLSVSSASFLNRQPRPPPTFAGGRFSASPVPSWLLVNSREKLSNPSETSFFRNHAKVVRPNKPLASSAELDGSGTASLPVTWNLRS